MDKVQQKLDELIKFVAYAKSQNVAEVMFPVENIAALAAFIGMYRDRAIQAEAQLQSILAKDTGTLQ